MQKNLPQLSLRDACRSYVDALIRAKAAATSRDEFWEDRGAAKAYKRVFAACSDAVKPDVQWHDEVWQATHCLADEVLRRRKLDVAEMAASLAKEIGESLQSLSEQEWIAM